MPACGRADEIRVSFFGHGHQRTSNHPTTSAAQVTTDKVEAEAVATPAELAVESAPVAAEPVPAEKEKPWFKKCLPEGMCKCLG
mmetsp:Transcript_26401/g.73926  ORF Transcript_26401/g.73926 Transcript_26401/m.73926 type:complete len:84 (+) Transcript_26401:424-675(+)